MGFQQKSDGGKGRGVIRRMFVITFGSSLYVLLPHIRTRVNFESHGSEWMVKKGEQTCIYLKLNQHS